MAARLGDVAQTFKTGDTVRLKSGGPDMTVVEVKTYDSGNTLARVIWFNSGPNGYELKTENILSEALTKATK
ncbi:hypothetical protein CAP48_11530 [Advenella sp. S44]|uniref:YodC family protein n=1 Tax=Advenella sp. S44 TaxID=1982755 RepID=UPI000C2B0A60|nr:DUF2158 domain-containing protein [Advenella sp. S44]PJX24128.1 hypothetical protein CAP48_11530 [Advenella sp. S44]